MLRFGQHCFNSFRHSGGNKLLFTVKTRVNNFHTKKYENANNGLFKPKSNKKSHTSKFPYVRVALGATLTSLILYDGVKNEFTYCGATKRFLRSLQTAVLISIDYWLLERHADEEDFEAQRKVVHQKSADRLLQTCLQNGGLYIKVGQGFAAINHILPKEYTDTLALLQDECLPTSQKDVEKVFQKDFGKHPEDIFAEFNYKPIAAASLAQVFKAKLSNGEEVAVKVQYGDLQKRFPSDLGTIIFLHDIIELIFKNYNFGWILRDLRKNLVHELDFIKEGENAEKCASDMKTFSFIHVPKIHWPYTKTRVLVMEWIDGFKISDMQQMKEKQLDIRDVDVKLFKTFAEQIFHTGFVHADPHASNVFVRKNQKTGKAELILLDHGLYEVLPEEVRLPLCEFWEATVLRNEKKMKEAATKIGIHDYMKFAEVLFQQPIRINNGRIKTKLTEEDIIYIQQVARKNFDLIMSTLKEMPRNMLFIVRNLNTVRAIGRTHGDVVDRPRIMARHAQRCIYAQHNSVLGWTYWLYRRAIFEYSLWSYAFKMSCLNMYFNILYKIGRAPESATTILKDIGSEPS